MQLVEGRHYFEDPSFPLYVTRYAIRPNEVIAPHMHDFVEFVYVESGGAIHEWADQRHPLAAGDVFAIEPMAVHSYVGAADRESVVYNILFHRSLLQHEMEALLRFPGFIDLFYLTPFMRNNVAFVPFAALDDFQRLQLDANLRAMRQEFRQRRDGYRTIVKNRWIECLILLSRYYADNLASGHSPRAKSIKQEDWIASIVDFVEEHCDRELSLAHLADTCRMSVSAFTAKFKRATGMSLVDYRHAAQIRRVKRLLDDTDMKIAGIAHEVGFNDISFFNRIFRRYADCTPREYRERNARGGDR